MGTGSGDWGVCRVRMVRGDPRGPRFRTCPVRRLAIVLGVLAAVLLIGGSPALAVPPMQLSGQITDQVNALGGNKSEVQNTLDRLRSDTGTEMFVAYVDSFDGMAGHTWAQQSCQASGLSGNQVLLAVATGDHSGGFFAGTTANQT